MTRKLIIGAAILGTITLAGCEKFLDRKPLDSASSETFLSTAPEMELGLNGVYAAAHWSLQNNTPLLFAIETTTDMAMKRTGNAEDLIAQGDGGPFLINNSVLGISWQQAYRLISRANYFLDGIKKGEKNVDAATYGRFKAEALALRAWGYFHVMNWFGDPVYYREPLAPDQYTAISRTPVATVVADLYKDLDEAVALMDAARLPATRETGKLNKGVALQLKARLALLIKDYATAAAASKAVMDDGRYSLNPRYTDLFMLNGQNANAGREIMFVQPYPTDVLNPQNWMVVLTIPRQVGTSQSSHFPTQQLVDVFETKNGLRIDRDPSYDPAKPSLNRDSRLRWTVYMQGDTMTHNTAKAPSGDYVEPRERTIFNIYSNQRIKWNWKTNKFDALGNNIDWIDFRASPWFAGATGSSGGVGYVWRKYVDSTQYSWETKTGFINMRFAEVLLTYAEAKIEQNQIDQTVVDAINRVRRRAGQPDVAIGGQAEMREIVRRERAAEFGGEGLRQFDLRRWDLVLKAMNYTVLGVSLKQDDPAPVPVFDADGIPNYSNGAAKRLATRGQVRVNTAKHKLWPLPQGEVDKNPNLQQNPGWQ